MLNGIVTLPDGRKLSYAEYGEPDGQPLIYCHGMPGSMLEHPDEDVMKKHHIRFLVPERPGYGDSSPNPERRTPLDWADDVAALLDELDITRSHLLGFSGGSPYALACIARFPQRFNKLGLLSSMAPFISELTEKMIPANCSLFELGRDDPKNCKVQLEQIAALPEQLYAAVTESLPTPDQLIIKTPAFAAMYQASVTRSLQQGIDGLLHDIHRITHDWGFDLSQIKQSIKLWHGGCDINTPPAMAKYLAKHLPNNQVHHYPDEAHLLYFKHWPEILATLLD